jgi:O-antigen biosynthesis protein WbqP
VLFKQKRVGKGKAHFYILKFRTMRVDTPCDVPTHQLCDPERWITRVGRFLRKTSLDELPQLWNILVGDMSIVGPRPALWNQDDLIAERDRHRGRFGLTPNDVRPGLTGWAQINGRDELPISVKARFDGEYVERLSFKMDCRCFFGTIGSVLCHKGVCEGGTGVKEELRVTLVSAYFAPEITPITHLYADLAEDLCRFGARVTVVTNLANRGLDERMRAEYLQKTDETVAEGYRILRVGIKSREGTGFFRRGMHFLINTHALLKAARKTRANVYLLGSMPPFLGLVGAKLSRKARTVYILQDIFPDSMVAMGKFTEWHPIVRASRRMEQHTYRKNSAFVTLSEDMKRTLVARGIPEQKVAVIPNWADTEAVKPIGREDNPLFDELNLSRECFYAVYAGTLGVLQEPDTLLDAAKLLKPKKDIRVVIFGGGALYEHVRARIENEQIDNALLFPLLPEERVAEVYSLGDAALVPLKAGTTRFAMPSKTLTALAAGRPVIVCADAGSEWARSIERESYGICVHPGEPREMADAILRLHACALPLQELGARARSYVCEHASREKATRAYYEWLTEKST